MNKEIKDYADRGEIRRLKYIFSDCLDVDPTFEKYKEDYEYCKSKGNIFEKHQELTPFQSEKNQWNKAYWIKLKMDLVSNFSEERLLHMVEVSKVVYKEKIERIKEERRKLEEENRRVQQEKEIFEQKKSLEVVPKQKTISKQEQQERELEKKRRQLEEENRRVVQEKKEVEVKRHLERENQKIDQEDSSIKKLVGVAITVAIIIVVMIAIRKLV